MDFNVIKEIGSAFLVGATALLVPEAYLYFSAGWTITGFFRLPIGIGRWSDGDVGLEFGALRAPRLHPKVGSALLIAQQSGARPQS